MRILSNAAFTSGQMHTGLIEQEKATLLPPLAPPSEQAVLLAVSQVLARELANVNDSEPWSATTGWRVGGPADEHSLLHMRPVNWLLMCNTAAHNALAGRCITGNIPAKSPILLIFPQRKWVNSANREEKFFGQVIVQKDIFHVFLHGRHETLALHLSLAHAGQEVPENGSLTAPMPGRIVSGTCTGRQQS